MFFLYVDESGDSGNVSGSSPIFVLSGLVLHELKWQPTLDAVITFRRSLRAQ